ncbi:MAG: hypothetical protein ABR579_04430 [Actinomycetota bacterium]
MLMVPTALLVSCDKKPLTSSQYVSRADSVCASVAAKAETPPAFTTPEQVDAFVKQTESLYQDLLTRLRDLKPPDSMRTKVAQMLAELQAVATYLPQLQKAVAANDQPRTSDLVTKIEEASATANRLAGELGLESCINAGNVGAASPSPVASPSE